MALYPPTIEGQLPPAVLWTDSEKNQIITFTIPYEINRGTDPLSIKGYSIRIKNLISDKLLGVFNIIGYQDKQIILNIADKDFIDSVDLGDNFKIQVAFGESVSRDSNQQLILAGLGYYSTVGICKYMNKPRLNIVSVNGGWRGEYISDQLNELLYSSQFVLKDVNKKILETGSLEVINYLNEEQEAFYQEYFEEVVMTQLEKILGQSNADLNTFNGWKAFGKNKEDYKVLIGEKLSEVESFNGDEATKGDKVIQQSAIYNKTKLEALRQNIATLNQKVENKDFGVENQYKLLLSDIAKIKKDCATLISNIKDDISSTGCSPSVLKELNANINTLNKELNKAVSIIDTKEVALNNAQKYWTSAKNTGYSDYYEAVKQSSKSIFYKFNTQLKLGYQYFIEWHIETSSGYKDVYEKSVVAGDEILGAEYSLIPKIRMDETNGIIEVSVETLEDCSTPKNFGHWKIFKGTSKDNFESWIEMYDVENFYSWYISPTDSFKHILIKDYDIEHGIAYRYALQQINEYGVRSVKIISSSMNSKFEDVFLCDENRQLRIAFNPKVSSMKNNILESKQDTIGGKYPHMFRNGNVLYKEFAISGMISYLEDPNNEFHVDFKEFNDVNTTNLTNDNITKERIFKTEVLDWLNNGKPKLLKTATEGNYVVRLISVSLTPNDTLGRMIHSFNATAVEIQDKDTMVRADLKKLDNERVHIQTIPDPDNNIVWDDSWISDKEVKSLWIYGKGPGSDSDPAFTVKINESNVEIDDGGLRLETWDGAPITKYDPLDSGAVAEVYYVLYPKVNKTDTTEFLNAASVEIKSYIGQSYNATKMTTPMWYKVLNIYYAPDDNTQKNLDFNGYNPNDTSRQVVLKYPDREETLSIVDSLSLSDVWIKEITLGDSLRMVFDGVYAIARDEGGKQI